MAKQKELPEMTGKGVEAVSIPEIDDSADEYERTRDKRMRLLEQEIEARTSLETVLRKHADKIRKPDGSVVGASHARHHVHAHRLPESPLRRTLR